MRCEQLHPSRPPRISRQRSGWVDRSGVRRERDVCLECKLVLEMARVSRVHSESTPDAPVCPQPYGVIALNWPAPRLDV
jgi:hypothetical protein